MEYLILLGIFFVLGLLIGSVNLSGRVERLLFAFGFAFMGASILFIKIFIIGSLITSSVKGIAGSCDKHYPVENYFYISGNWFCSKEKQE